MSWAQGIVTLQPGVSALVADANPIFKAHLFLGMTLFLVFPFTRLVHVWSAPIWYLGRAAIRWCAARGRTARRAVPASSPRSDGHVLLAAFRSAAERPRRAGQWRRDRARCDRPRGPAPSRRAARSKPGRRRRGRSSCASCCCRRRGGLASRPSRCAMTTDAGETAEEAAVRALVEREVRTPRADTETCRRYYEQNRQRFRSAGHLRSVPYSVRGRPQRRGGLCAGARGRRGFAASAERDARPLRRTGEGAFRLSVRRAAAAISVRSLPGRPRRSSSGR